MKRLLLVIAALLFSVPAFAQNPVAISATERFGVGVAANATTAAAGSLIAKASSGNLYQISLTSGASAGYLMVFNATSVPADGTVSPVICTVVSATSSIALQYHVPVYLNTGVTAVFSTTGCFTKTISATAFISALVK